MTYSEADKRELKAGLLGTDPAAKVPWRCYCRSDGELR
jgi:hypothetical protein